MIGSGTVGMTMTKAIPLVVLYSQTPSCLHCCIAQGSHQEQVEGREWCGYARLIHQGSGVSAPLHLMGTCVCIYMADKESERKDLLLPMVLNLTTR